MYLNDLNLNIAQSNIKSLDMLSKAILIEILKLVMRVISNYLFFLVAQWDKVLSNEACLLSVTPYLKTAIKLFLTFFSKAAREIVRKLKKEEILFPTKGDNPWFLGVHVFFPFYKITVDFLFLYLIKAQYYWWPCKNCMSTKNRVPGVIRR